MTTVRVQSARRRWAWAPGLLGAAAGLVELGKALAVTGQPAARAPGLVSGLIGVVALVGVALVWTRLYAAALILATAGLAAITVDGLGSPPPRMLPGAALVIAAAALAGSAADSDGTPATFTWGRLAAWAGLGLQLVIGIPLVAIGLVVPGWAVTALWAAWGAFLFLILRCRLTRPWLALVIPLATAVLLASVVSLGERLLGWSA